MHPQKKEELILTAPLPNDMRSVGSGFELIKTTIRFTLHIIIYIKIVKYLQLI